MQIKNSFKFKVLKYRFSLFFLFFAQISISQFKNNNHLKFPNNFHEINSQEKISIEKLNNKFYSLNNDSLKVKILIDFIDSCYNINIWSKINNFTMSFIELKLQQNLSKKENNFYKNNLANTFINKGYIYGEEGKINLQLKYYQNALEIFEENGYLKGISQAYNNIGYIYDKRGMINIALDYYLKSLKIKEKLSDSLGIANTKANLAFNFLKINNIENAEKYFKQSLEIRKKINDSQGIINSNNQLGNIYLLHKNNNNNEKNSQKAYQYYLNAYNLSKENNDEISLCETMMNLGNYYQLHKNYSKALDYYNYTLDLQVKLNDVKGLIQSNKSISELYFSQNQLNKAEFFAQTAYFKSKKLGFPHEISESSFLLYKIFRKLNKVNDALKYHEEYLKMRDSVVNNALIQKNLELNIQYDYDKKKYADSLKNAERKKMSDLKIKAQNLELKHKKTLNYSLIFGLLFLLLFLYFIFKKYKTEKIQKEIIQHQKKIVDEQKIIVEEQHKEITDSIKYAERIQGAILPPDQKWLKILPNSFVLNKPKDILSGDFYWIAQTDDQVFFAAADCTGHGVPGALISIVNFNLLNKAVLERHLKTPAEVLDAVNIWLTESLNQTEEGSTIKDGMDIALVSFNKKNGQILYAGANNPLYWFHKNELVEIKGDKFPVGAFIDEDVKHFTNKEVPAQFGDSLYLFSDGFADQFGGPNGKKYKYKQLKEKFFEILDDPIEEQKINLEVEFRSWKGQNEQTDDVLIIGVKINSNINLL